MQNKTAWSGNARSMVNKTLVSMATHMVDDIKYHYNFLRPTWMMSPACLIRQEIPGMFVTNLSFNN